LLDSVVVAETTPEAARQALRLQMRDLEDAFQAVSALHCKAGYIVTRNTSAHRCSPVRAVSPAQFIALTSD